MSASNQTFEGGCLCGAVRYRVTRKPRWIAHCHCQSCRRQTGSPMTTFVGVDSDALTYLAATPQRYESSPQVWRSFCGRCGSAIAFEATRWPGEVHLYLGSLDRPEDFPPQGHVHVAEQIPWLHIADDLPRHAQSGASSAGKT